MNRLSDEVFILMHSFLGPGVLGFLAFFPFTPYTWAPSEQFLTRCSAIWCLSWMILSVMSLCLHFYARPCVDAPVKNSTPNDNGTKGYYCDKENP